MDQEFNEVADLMAASDFFTNFDTSEWRRWCRAFIIAMMATDNPELSATKAGITRPYAYRFRWKNKEFDRAWTEAREVYYDRLEAKLSKWAVDGVEETVFHGGKKVG